MSHIALGRSTHVRDGVTPPGAAIDVVDLVKQFGHNRALNGVIFQVPRGTVFGVIGPNGAGKTTIMRALLDIIRPTSGQATVLGTRSRNAGPELRRRIGYLPGELILEGRTSGRCLLAHYADISGPVAAGHVQELAERLRLDLDRPVRKLSKGNKQKLAIVQAFMHQAELLVLDEPTSGLDPLMQQEVLRLVREARDRGQTVFLSSHVISEIQQAADEVAILRGGSIVTINSVEELRATAIRHLRLVASGIRPTDLAATGAGYTQATLFGLIGFLLLSIAATSWGAGALGGDEESGRLELTLAHGVTPGTGSRGPVLRHRGKDPRALRAAAPGRAAAQRFVETAD
ncbi:ABC-type multidrug transport system, ATPase component [Cryobacterium flavum]|uniref:ABC-type multidrug transport system, ATPase component n=1 Tax=Cryobacterium flavum TaxID=1424659 RepID=A0A5E9G174_9MICO|nr:ABC-type multidrug transport system, ATPase component [Cryobacterium flavum]